MDIEKSYREIIIHEIIPNVINQDIVLNDLDSENSRYYSNNCLNTKNGNNNDLYYWKGKDNFRYACPYSAVTEGIFNALPEYAWDMAMYDDWTFSDGLQTLHDKGVKLYAEERVQYINIFGQCVHKELEWHRVNGTWDSSFLVCTDRFSCNACIPV